MLLWSLSYGFNFCGLHSICYLSLDILIHPSSMDGGKGKAKNVTQSRDFRGSSLLNMLSFPLCSPVCLSGNLLIFCPGIVLFTRATCLHYNQLDLDVGMENLGRERRAHCLTCVLAHPGHLLCTSRLLSVLPK